MSVKKLEKAINILRGLDSDIPISVIVTLVALGDGEEKEVRDLAKEIDLSTTSLNRALTYLGDRHWSKASTKKGLGLVVQTISPEDRRVRCAMLTPKGRRVIQSIEGVFQNDETTKGDYRTG